MRDLTELTCVLTARPVLSSVCLLGAQIVVPAAPAAAPHLDAFRLHLAENGRQHAAAQNTEGMLEADVL
jgi:hypothetical protein